MFCYKKKDCLSVKNNTTTNNNMSTKMLRSKMISSRKPSENSRRKLFNLPGQGENFLGIYRFPMDLGPGFVSKWMVPRREMLIKPTFFEERRRSK